MKLTEIVVIVKVLLVLVLSFSCQQSFSEPGNDKFVSFILNPKTSNIEFFWKDDAGQFFKSIQTLKNYVEKKGQRLRFAMNGGMYEPGNLPKGLFIQNHKMLVPLDVNDGDGNFYIKPNGVFYLTIDNQPLIAPTQIFSNNGNVKLATQSGPLLLLNGEINSQFKENSTNLNLRNGVGILPDGKIVFAITRQETNFYQFARYFKNLGCREALYLDGFVSRMYLPEQDFEQLDGDFAVIIGVTE